MKVDIEDGLIYIFITASDIWFAGGINLNGLLVNASFIIEKRKLSDNMGHQREDCI